MGCAMFGIIASLLFVLIWSTGFIVARAMVPHGAPELILADFHLDHGVVGSQVVGVQEVVDSGRTGLLVEHANPQALADALATLLNQPQDAARMAAAAHAEVLQRYGLNTMTDRYEALLGSLLEKPVL